MKAKLLALLIVFSLGLLNAQGDENELIVVRTEMDSSMTKYAHGEAEVLLSSNPDFKSVATELIEAMNKQYGKEWICLIGTNLNPLVIGMEIVNNTFLLMEYKSNHIVLVKQYSMNINKNQTNIQSIIEEAKQSDVITIHTDNPANFNKFTELAKKEVNAHHEYCGSSTISNDIDHWCYKEMSANLINEMKVVLGVEGLYTATIGNRNFCFSFSSHVSSDSVEAHLFILGEIYFEIAWYKIA